MRKSMALTGLASVYALSLLGFTGGCLSPVYAAQSDDYYRFTDPSLAPKELTVRAPATVLPTPVRIANIKVQNAILDPSANGGKAHITYTMPEPGFVTVRVLRRGTRELYLATILNFEFRDVGTHTEIWDGRDYYGNRLDASVTPFSYRMRAESLAADSPPPGYKNIEYEEGMTQEKLIAKTNFTRHMHNWHAKKYEHIPLLTIDAPKANDNLSGKVIVQSAIDRERRSFGNKYGYGVRYYVDDEIIHEEFYTPESGGNFSYQLDTTAFEDGKHLLYVGLCDHNDHVTSHGIEVVFNNLGK